MKLSLRYKEILTGVLAPGLALLAFGLGEVALRVVNLNKFGTTTNVRATDAFVFDKTLGLSIPTPGARLGVIQFNSRGFRGPELDAVPAPQTLRIAFVGSSTTYDGGIPESKTWAAQTTRILQEQLPQGCRVEYLNAGSPGFRSVQMLNYFKYRIRELMPHVTVILPGDLTTDNAKMLRERGYNPLEATAPSWFARQSLLWNKIEVNLNVISLQRAARRGKNFVDFDEVHYGAIFATRLDELVRGVMLDNTLPVLVTLSARTRLSQTAEERLDAALTTVLSNPYTAVDDLIEGREEYNRKIRQVAESTNALLVDRPDMIPADGRHYQDSIHFTAAGCAVQGQRVAGTLLDSEVFLSTVRALGGACSTASR